MSVGEHIKEHAILGVPSGASGEPALGNPAADDYVLSSKMDGTRAWVSPSAAIETDPIAGAITGIVMGDGAGNLYAATPDSEYLTPGTAATTFAPYQDAVRLASNEMQAVFVLSTQAFSGWVDMDIQLQSANSVFAGPTTGSPALPAFRSLTTDDLPAITVAQVEAASAITPVADGTYTVGAALTPGVGVNGTITVASGIITAIQEAT